MEDKKAHDLAVVITKGIMGKDFFEDKTEPVKYAFCMEWWDQDIQYEGHYDSVQKCLDQALGYLYVDYNYQPPIGIKVFVGVKEEADIPKIDARNLLEDLSQDSYNEYGEIAIDYLDDVTDEHAEILEKELNTVFRQWAAKYYYKPTFFNVRNIKTYTYDGEKWVLKNECKNCDK